MSKSFSLSDFDYFLPPELIAQEPVLPRDSCKMLVFDSANSRVSHKVFSDIEDYLLPGDLVVLNSSKVVPARIVFLLDGKEVEIFVLKDCSDGIFECLVRPGKKFPVGAKGFIRDIFSFEVLSVDEEGHRLVRFLKDGALASATDLYDNLGVLPLPPYIKNFDGDKSFYQTVYAEEAGSLAAPTAGLHFTPELMDRLKLKGVIFKNVILHVGLGTFLPVKVDKLDEHKMHEEFFYIPEETAVALNSAKEEGRRVVAIGTTTVRVLESVFKAQGEFSACSGSTDIFIYPGAHEWRVVDALVTNFHLPKSTLLMLVSSFLEFKVGNEDSVKILLDLYAEAIEKRYRFFSFGDAMFIY